MMIRRPATSIISATTKLGTSGFAVPVTIDGTTFVNGATVSAGTGITVGNVAFVSSTRLTATFTIAADATGRARDETETNPKGPVGPLEKTFPGEVPRDVNPVPGLQRRR